MLLLLPGQVAIKVRFQLQRLLKAVLRQVGTKSHIDKATDRICLLLPVAGQGHKQPLLQIDLLDQPPQIH